MRALPILLLSLVASLRAEPPKNPAAGNRPGQVDASTVRLPNQWLLKPAGRQVAVGDFPVNIAMHPGGKFAAVLHCGYSVHEIVVLDLEKRAIHSRTAIKQAFYGLTFSRDGAQLFCSGSGDEVLHIFGFAEGQLVAPTSVPLREVKKRGIPAGIAVTADAKTIYVANVWGHTVSRIATGADGRREISELMLDTHAPAEVAPRPPTTDDPSITKRAEALLDTTDSRDPFPYAAVLDEQRGQLYVSLWAQAQVAVIDTAAFKVITHWKVEEHPNEMLLTKDGARLFVANANRNSVSVIDTATGRTVETLVATLTPDAPPGNTPNSLALSPDEKRLFVANANINTIAVFEIEKRGPSHSLGFIPVGWYPTSVRVTPDGQGLLVANGKGVISKANPRGPMSPIAPKGVREYIGSLMQGTVSFLELPKAEALAKQLAAWSADAFACMPDTRKQIDAAALAGNPVPRKIGDPSPIKYCIYIVKENRTYDQVFGAMEKGKGDPRLCIFGEKVTPNHHALAREFVLLDNFYVESEVSADGHEWTMGAYATDFVEKNWPLSYGHNKGHNKFPYPSEGDFAIAAPAGGYLWDRAKEAGVTYRSYGEFVENGKKPDDPCTTRVAALQGHFDPHFRSFDMNYPDVKRAERFISELRRFEQEGDMPRLQIVRLPNDHGSGTSPGKPTPTAHMAENDLAFGMLVEAVSRSKFWPETAIFVVEDDAQNGPDHIDAHRTIAFVISPYVRRGSVDSSLYSTSSMLRTMELILGLKPMSQFDAAALPMFASFQKEPDLTPFTARPAQVNIDERNSKTAWGAEESMKMNFAKEDAADDLLLNEIIWRSVRGADSPMPAPVRAAFVFVEEE
jgi:YVTN family beta-propeller protein